MSRPTARLTRTAILEAGILLADREGLTAVTMRRLGESLGVEAMSLYRHVTNKQDVLDAMASLLVSRMEPTELTPDTPWQDVLREITWAYRRLIVAHPAVFTAQAGRPLVLGEDDTAITRVLATLESAGFPRDEALDLYLVGSSYARGFALSDIGFNNAHKPLPADANSDRAFQKGLDVIIEGFEHRLTAH